MLRTTALCVWGFVLLALCPQTHQQDVDYKMVALPPGTRPEGVTAGSQNDLWVACLSGAVLHVDLDTNTSSIIHQEHGVALSGAKFCKKQQILFAAGSLSGKGYLFHMQQANSSSSISTNPQYTVAKKEVLQLANKPGVSYINDVALSSDRAYFTDSFHPILYSIPRFSAAANGSSAATRPVQQHQTGTYFDTKVGQFRANGAAVHSSSSRKDTLLIANTHTGNMYSVEIIKPAQLAGGSEPPGAAAGPGNLAAAAATLSGAQPYALEPLAAAVANILVPNSNTTMKAALDSQRWPPPVVQELALPKIKGKVSERLLLDGVWVVNSSQAYVADNYNNRIWGLSITDDKLSSLSISCLLQAPVFGVPTTLAFKQGLLWLVNAHLDTCFPFLPCPWHKFEVIGVETGQCRPWP